MKNSLKYLVLAVLSVSVLAGCGKSQQQANEEEAIRKNNAYQQSLKDSDQKFIDKAAAEKKASGK